MNHERRNSVRAVVSDLAGTLVDHGCLAPAIAFKQVFAERGVAIDDAQARGPMGLNKRDHIEAILAIPSVAEAFVSANGRPHGAPDVDAMYARFTPVQIELLRTHSQAIPGAIEALAELRRRRIKIGVNSGYARDMVEVVVASLKNQDFVPDAWVSADDVAGGRPEPWMMLRALERMRVYPSYLGVKVGDTVPDIEEGKNAGAWTVGVLRTGNMLGLDASGVEALSKHQLAARLSDAAERFRWAGVDYTVETLADLPSVIDAIDKRLAIGERP